MKFFVAMLFVVQAACFFQLDSKCVRTEHIKEKDNSKKYECTVRVNAGEILSNNPSFKDGYCNKCGCHASDHNSQ